MLTAMLLTSCRTSSISEATIDKVFGNLDGSLVLIDCSSGRTTTYRPDLANTPLPPCSTFKILNALIGLETGLATSSDEKFYRWDGVKRSIPAWNRDLTLREAFQASCVPAFQNLARRIGPEQMQRWIDKVSYGNGNISTGIDRFWLPAKDRETILISPNQQAGLMQKIVSRNTPFSDKSLAVLKELMFIKKTDRGVLYGKTGSGANDDGLFVLGWFVGYVESNGKSYAFACVAQGKNVMSKNAREIAEHVLKKQGLL